MVKNAGNEPPRVLVLLADGSEEMEVVIVVDVLRRAGCEVVLASMEGRAATCSRGVMVSPDAALEEQRSDDFDALVVPGGGPGTDVLAASESVMKLVRGFSQAEKLIGAVCAGPKVLEAAGVLSGRRFTCHPGVAADLPGRLAEPVVRDGHLLTSQGPGTCFAFALAMAESLCGLDIAEAVAGPLMLISP